MEAITFFVPGTPAPGGSKKGFYIKSINRVVMAPASDKTRPWMNTVSHFARMNYQGPLIEGPVRLEMTFKAMRTKGHYGTGKKAGILKQNAPTFVTVRPDLTKLERSTEDALTGILWRDDGQVVQKATSKIYTDRDPGVLIKVTEINAECTPQV